MNTALKCEADYIGLVFFENSPRNISINLSKELLKLRNKLSKIVALTVNPSNEFLFSIGGDEDGGGCCMLMFYPTNEVFPAEGQRKVEATKAILCKIHIK